VHLREVLLLIGTFCILWGPTQRVPLPPSLNTRQTIYGRSHLKQLVGVALMAAALLFLAQRLATENAIGCGADRSCSAIVNLALATVLQSGDGVR